MSARPPVITPGSSAAEAGPLPPLTGGRLVAAQVAWVAIVALSVGVTE